MGRIFPQVHTTAHGIMLTHVDAPAGQVYPESIDPKLNDLHIGVVHASMSGLRWNLMIPENFQGSGREPRTGFRPALGMKWRATADSLTFDDLRYRENIDLDVRAAIQIEHSDALRYTVAARNPTAAPIEHINFNACFYHRAAVPFGNDVFVYANDRWIRTFDATPKPDMPYFILRDRESEWRTSRQEQEHFPIHPTIKPTEGIIATTATIGGKPRTLAHASPDAVMVWHNHGNPCTDLWLWIGTLAPGDERNVSARIYFLDGDLDEAMNRMRSDAW